MSLRRFVAPNARQAMAQVRQAFGDDAVVMSSRTCEGGVELLAMPASGMEALQRMAKPTPAEPETPVQKDVATMAMSTLSFQDYVRDRLLRRRHAHSAPTSAAETAAPPVSQAPSAAAAAAAVAGPALTASLRGFPVLRDAMPATEPPRPAPVRPRAARPSPPVNAAPGQDAQAVMSELRSMRGLLEQQLGALAFLGKLEREPRQTVLAHKLLDCGFSPLLVRRLASALPKEVDVDAWAADALERNLSVCPVDQSPQETGGVYALIGATGVGKTTSAAKMAAAFAARHGAGQLGLITLDAYRVGAHEQLRQYGRILGVPVHTAHDRASLDDLLDLLAAKRLVLVDTAGTAQRDTRTREILESIGHPSIKRILVMNAASQAETFEDVLAGYEAAGCLGVVLSKIDEAVKLGPALDSLLRHRLSILAVSNGQRVPEDWHHLSASALVRRALRSAGAAAWRLESADLPLVFGATAATASRLRAES